MACTAVPQERWILSAGVDIGSQEASKMVSKTKVEALNTLAMTHAPSFISTCISTCITAIGCLSQAQMQSFAATLL